MIQAESSARLEETILIEGADLLKEGVIVEWVSNLRRGRTRLVLRISKADIIHVDYDYTLCVDARTGDVAPFLYIAHLGYAMCDECLYPISLARSMQDRRGTKG